MSGTVSAVVFLDGDYEDADFYLRLAAAADLLIAADGGARVLADHGLRPDALVGDFDSLAPALLQRFAAEGVPIVRHPVRKDQTDGELAVEEAVRRGAGEIVLAGALGALDHTLGHLAILRRLAARGVPARLSAPGLTVIVMTAPSSQALLAARGTRVSLAPLSGDAVVTLVGMEYPLERGVLPADGCLGLGNSVAGEAAVTVHRGTVAVLVGQGAGPEAQAPAGPEA